MAIVISAEGIKNKDWDVSLDYICFGSFKFLASQVLYSLIAGPKLKR